MIRADVDGTEPVDRDVTGRTWWPWAVVLMVLAALPVLVALWVLRDPTWFPAGDMAQAELHVRGFWQHPPLVGAAGRLGTLEDQGSHPGPALWLAMYPLYTLFGRSAYGLMVGAASVHLVSIGFILWVARRRAGNAFMVLMGAALVVLVRASGPTFFIEPWNPWLAVFPFLLFLLLLWDVLEGETRRFPWAVGVGTFCIQCHVGYLPIVGALSAGVLVFAAWQSHRRGERVVQRLGRPLAWTAVVLVVLWLPPVIDQLIHDPGNLEILYRNFRYPTEAAVGLGAAVKAFAGEVNLFGPWLVGRGHLPTSSPNIVGFVALLVPWGVAAVVAVRRRYSDLCRLHGLLAATCVVGIVAISRITGTPFDYLVRWLWAVTALIVVASAFTVYRWWLERASQPVFAERAVAVGALAVAVVVGLVAAPKFADAQLPGERDSAIIGELAAGAGPGLDPAGHYLVRWSDPTALGASGFGTLLELARDGFHVGVDRPQRAGALPFRVLDEGDATGVVYVIVGDQIERWRQRDDATELAYAEPRTPAEQAEGEEIHARLVARLNQLGRPDLVEALDRLYASVLFAPGMPDDVQADIARLTDLRLPAAVFLTAPVCRLSPRCSEALLRSVPHAGRASGSSDVLATMAAMRTVVVVPTYQEAGNVTTFLRGVRDAVPEAEVLVVDDNSPDGTAALAEAAVAELGQIKVLRRGGKQGLGTAYREGFRLAVDEDYDVIVHMDVDLSHDPAVIPEMLRRIEGGAGVVIGSRYVPGGATPNWPAHRRWLSRWGNRYTAAVLRLPLTDVTSGYRAVRAEVLRAAEPASARAEGYAFLTELARRYVRNDTRIEDVPIVFRDREHGESKMSVRIITESMVLVTLWGAKDVVHRRRRRRVTDRG